MKKLSLLLFATLTVWLANAVNVTFRVDMSQQTVSPQGVQIAGSFNSWSTTATPMTNSGGNVYTVTLDLTAATAYQYKFINGNTWAGEEIVPAACGVSNGMGGYNREVTVAASAMVLDVVCFSQCGPCSAPVNLTLQVDMSQQTVSPNGVYVAGSFNNWSTTATPLLPQGGGVYAATFAVNGGTAYQYKFINGNTWAGEETVPSACGVPNGFGGYNREVTVAAANITVPVVCFNECGPCATTTVTLTLQVDMSQQTVSPDGVYVAGSFNTWSTTATPMTAAGGGVYSATLTVNAGSTHQYKFINGNTWAGEETVPAACGVSNGSGGYNREVTLGTTNTSVPVVCFSQCGPCAGMVNLTLQVDMGMQTVSTGGIHVAGTFNNWSTTATIMNNTGGTVYSATVAVIESSVHDYKFINGDTWAGEEIVPEACGVPNGSGGFNRQVTLGTTNQTLPVVCFSQCGPCPPQVNVTFRVDMSMETVSPDGVHIAGSFQGWNPAASPMLQTLNNVWEITFSLYQGQVYQYKFINGNTFAGEEIVPEACGVPNGSGGFDRLITVGSSQTILPAVCFSSCGECPLPQDAVFRVDMSQQTVSPGGVHIAGSFQGWDPAASPMTAVGNGVYEFVAQIMAGEEVQYKFINGNTWADEETVPEACGTPNGTGGFNRFFTMPAADTTLGIVCYSECVPCQGSTLVEVTFRVDLSQVTVAPEGIFLAGSFQGWNPASTPMTYIGGGVYEKKVLLNEAEYVEYKFINGNTWEGAEEVPEACGVPTGVGGFNRFLTVPAGGNVQPIVCFAMCGPCPVGLYDVTNPEGLALFPNPAKGEINLRYTGSITETIEWTLYNSNGLAIRSGQFRVVTGENTLAIMVPRHAGLCHFVLRNGSGKTLSTKILLQ